MKYRIYKDWNYKGYKSHKIVTTEKQLLKELDKLIIEQKIYGKVLVIKQDDINNCDEPFFLYQGDIEDYEEFKEEISAQVKILKKKLK